MGSKRNRPCTSCFVCEVVCTIRLLLCLPESLTARNRSAASATRGFHPRPRTAARRSVDTPLNSDPRRRSNKLRGFFVADAENEQEEALDCFYRGSFFLSARAIDTSDGPGIT